MASAMERGSATTATMTPETTSWELSFELFAVGVLDDAEKYRFDLVALQCSALPCRRFCSVRAKSVPPGSTGRNASEYYAVGFDFALRHYTARLQEGNKSGKPGIRPTQSPSPFPLSLFDRHRAFDLSR